MLTEEQHEQRKKGIGASEASVVMGLSSFMTPYKLWMIKTGRMEPDDFSNNDLIWWGNQLEPVIAKRYEYETGETLEHRTETFFHKKYPYILCHPDRFVFGKRKLVEIKTGWFDSDKWGESGTDQVPPEYVIQVQHQLAVVGYEEADLIVYFTNSGRTHIYTMKRDEELISLLESSIDTFWNKHVLGDIAPDLIAISDYKMKFPKNKNDNYLDATPEILEVLTELNQTRIKLNEEKQKDEEILKPIFEFIGEASGIKLDNKVVARWTCDKNGKRSFRLNMR